jgi:hypothetical protein
LSHDSEVEEVFKGADEKLFYRLNNYIDDEWRYSYKLDDLSR